MTIPVSITFRHIESSAAVETRINELAAHLGTFSDRIQSCRVVVDSPHRHQHQGKVFNVNVQLTLPGGDVVVDMERPIATATKTSMSCCAMRSTRLGDNFSNACRRCVVTRSAATSRSSM